MKTLILTRHAKSSWSNLNLSDHERTLNDRGRVSAAAIGRWLKSKNYIPDQIISSNAQRCFDTWEGIASEIPDLPDPSFHQRLYLAAPVAMYEALKQAKGDTVLMLGHNPGIAELASELAGSSRPDHPKFDQYPSAATTIITFDIAEWSTPFMGKGTAVDFIVPRDLLG